MGPKGRKDKKSNIPTGFGMLHDKYGEYIFIEVTDRLYELNNAKCDGLSDGFSDVCLLVISSLQRSSIDIVYG